MIKVVTQ